MAPRSCLLLLLLVPVCLGQPPVCGMDPCVTDCTSCSSGEKVADPEDCHSFYICDGSGNILTPQPLQCPAGTHFDAVTHACVSGSACTDCPRCYFECHYSKNNMIPDKKECSTYYECNGDYPGFKKSCPAERPFFDGFDCQSDHSRCCSCVAYCDSHDVNTLIPDPIDCRKFYLCDVVGEAVLSGSCEEGEFFDSIAHNCSPFAHCNTECKNVVDGNGCIHPYTCTATGYFPKCPSLCTPDYYHCTTVSETYIESEACSPGFVFHPLDHVCVKAADCPF